MKKRIFVGQFVSEIESYGDKRISQAGNNYQLKFIDMVKPYLSISIVPFFYDRSKISNDNSKVCKLTSKYSNKILKLIHSNIQAYKKIKKLKPNTVWIYNITISNVLLYVMLRMFTSFKLFFIVADFHVDNKILQYIFKSSLSKSSGAIVLNHHIGKLLNCNTFVLPGIIKDDAIKMNKNVINKDIIFSGSLAKTTGFELALEFANQHKEFTLHITGRPFGYTDKDFDVLLNSYTSSNIIYHGQLPFNEYIALINTCTYSFSLRDPIDVQHDYNFPSKILEYLSQGLIVISSKSYRELDSSLYLKTDYNSESIKASIITFETNYNIQNVRAHIYNNMKNKYGAEALNKVVLDLEKD